jgi:O-antigen/teichoic acid export membrane protein
MGVFNLGLQAVENYALPRLSASFHRGAAVFMAQRAALGRRMLLAAGPLLALLALGAGPLVAHFGPTGGAEYAGLLRWCCLLYGIILLVYPLRLTVRLLGDARHYFGGYVLSIAASLASVRWLTAHYQASGVVLGWLLAQLVLGAYWAWATRRSAASRPLGVPPTPQTQLAAAS